MPYVVNGAMEHLIVGRHLVRRRVNGWIVKQENGLHLITNATALVIGKTDLTDPVNVNSKDETKLKGKEENKL